MKKNIFTLFSLYLFVTALSSSSMAEQTFNQIIQPEAPAIECKTSNVVLTADAKEESTFAKTKSATKNAAKKAALATKQATKKTADTTKSVTKKTIDGTKDVIDNVNPAKTYTKEELEESAAIKKLKDEKKEINSAYDSRIKDVKAKIKSTENNSSLSEYQRRNKVYKLNKELENLEKERDNYIKEYNSKIEQAREIKRQN